MLRLTLRTLLAYLDDTLDPAQAKDMGRRVAESEFAQETVERIKSVTRRRRLAAPALDPEDSRADPNTIAEYLDNTLSSEHLEELEVTALKHDVLLAEVAASHQILTLVLGEPAKVPPSARRRMYGLVTGPEAVPNREPSAAVPPIAGVAPPPKDIMAAGDDDLLGSMGGPQKYAVFGGLAALAAALAVAVWLAIPKPPEPARGQGYVAFAPPPPVVIVQKVADPKIPPADPKIPPAAVGDPKTPAVPLPDPRVVEAVVKPPAPKDASAARVAVGLYTSPTQPLLARKAESAKWELVKADDARLSSTDTLMALPGFRPAVKLDNGLEVQLWGNVPELLNLPILEARVTFYQPAEGYDADFSLHAGRVYIKAPAAKQAVKIRVRFLDEIWNITLADATTAIALDRLGEPAKGPIFEPLILESPRALVYLGVLAGEATVQVGLSSSGPLAAGTKYKWDSKGGRAAVAPENDADEAALADRWSQRTPNTPAAKDMEGAIAEWVRRTAAARGGLDAEAGKALLDPKEAPSHRALAAWILQAIDDIPGLLDGLELGSSPVRDAIVRAARHWCAQAPDREKAFAVLLAEKKTFPDDRQRDLVQALLRSRADAAKTTADRLFTLLKSERLAIRELARFQLAQLDPISAEEAGYEAAADPSRRADQIAKWQATFLTKK